MILDYITYDIIHGTETNCEITDDDILNITKDELTTWLRDILTSGYPIKQAFIRNSDTICKVFTELKQCINFNQNNKYHKNNVYEHMLNVVDGCSKNDFIIKLAALFHDIGKPKTFALDNNSNGHFYEHPNVSYNIVKNETLNKIILSNDEESRFLNLVKYHDIFIEETKESVNKAYRKFGESFLQDWFILKQADLDDHIFPDGKPKWLSDINKLKEILHSIIEEESQFSLEDLNIDCSILIHGLGIEEGKQIDKILNTLLKEVIEGKIENDSDVLIQRAFDIKDI